ncbi:MAG: DUF1801 domain-containing protein [Saprospiraceae bacterium]
MTNSDTNPIDTYIATYPKETQILLEQVRATIRNAAPEAQETMSYGIPTFKMKRNLVHFAGYKNHIGFYPGASGIANFQRDISAYKSAKGSIQFPIDQAMPLALIERIVAFRVQEEMSKAK